MKKLFLIWFTFYFIFSYAQEPLMPLIDVSDSTAVAAERQLMYYQLLSGTLPIGEFMEPIQLPEFNFKNEMLKRQNFEFYSKDMNFNTFAFMTPGHFGIGTSPFLRDETVFSGASYQINERFTLGGYSFGANSIFSAPFPNQGMNNFDVRGSTMFLKYNVSKNFKIETRINITQGTGY
ncbi:MAG: hypothetical protein V2I31_02775 [Mariniphaga sp.]|nr:hypothetical protein [Mariniphaga sp.]